MHGHLLLSAGVVLALHALPHAAHAQPYLPSDFSIVASAAPASYTGPCPVTINFSVVVTSKVSASATLKRDTFDNALNPFYLLQVAAPGSASMSTTRKQLKTASGWEQYSLVSPVKGVTSGKVTFNVVCTNPSPPAPGDPTTTFTPQPGAQSPRLPKPGTGNVAPANQVPEQQPGPPTGPQRQERPLQR